MKLAAVQAEEDRKQAEIEAKKRAEEEEARRREEEAEAALVKESVSVLREMSGQPVTGWWSPGKSESWKTLKHLVDNGIEYCCDWVNDDMPYTLNDGTGRDFEAVPFGDGEGAVYGLAVGDVDGDGRADVVVARSGAPCLVHFNDP